MKKIISSLILSFSLTGLIVNTAGAEEEGTNEEVLDQRYSEDSPNIYEVDHYLEDKQHREWSEILEDKEVIYTEIYTKSNETEEYSFKEKKITTVHLNEDGSVDYVESDGEGIDPIHEAVDEGSDNFTIMSYGEWIGPSVFVGNLQVDYRYNTGAAQTMQARVGFGTKDRSVSSNTSAFADAVNNTISAQTDIATAGLSEVVGAIASDVTEGSLSRDLFETLLRRQGVSGAISWATDFYNLFNSRYNAVNIYNSL